MRIISTTLFLSVSLLTYGCSSVGDLKSRGSVHSFSSPKNAQAVAGCVSDSFVQDFSTRMDSVSSRVTSTGYAVQHDNNLGLMGKTVIALVEIHNRDNNGSVVEVFFAFDAVGSHKNNVRRIVESCV